MTKLKSKKMTKSTFAIIIMAIAMVAMLAFGGTYAYFTATTSAVDSGEVTMGYVKLSTTAVAGFTTAVADRLPGDTVLNGGVTLDPTGTSRLATDGAYLAVRITIGGTAAASASALGFDTALGNDWQETSKDSGIYITKEVVKASKTIFATGFTIPASLADTWTGTSSTQGLMGKTITIKVESAAVQGANTSVAQASTAAEALFTTGD